MTGPQEEFEDRIRRVLDQAARRLEVRPVVWHGPLPKRRRWAARPDLGSMLALVGVLFAVLIAVLALALLGRQHSQHAAAPSGTPLPSVVGAAFEPRLTSRQRTYIGAAWRATVRSDPACNGFHGRELTTGSPSRALTSRFAILRHAARPQGAFLNLLRAGGRVWSKGAQLYVNQIQRARSAYGATFYVIPAGNVTGQRGVPFRCGPEQVGALKRELSQTPLPQRARILRAQRRYIAYLRYSALHAEGVCATFVLPHAGHLSGGDNFGCATLADFGRWGVLADTQAYLGGSGAAFWTVVPDSVATVTLTFSVGPTRRQTATITVRAVNNVVAAKEPYQAPDESGFPSTIVLRAKDGRLIKKIDVTPNMPTLCGYGC